MASKSQVMNYILENFETKEGLPVSLSKLDSYKKAELEDFLKEQGEYEKLESKEAKN